MGQIEELELTEVAPELSGLDRNQIIELIKEYYSKELTVAEIISQFGLAVTPGRLVSLFPPQLDENTPCKHCGSPMYRKWVSRTSGGYSLFSDDAVCMECGHKLFFHGWPRCSCSACTEERERERLKVEADEQRRQEAENELIAQACGAERIYNPQSDILSVDLKTAIYLLAMERQSISGHIGLFSSLNESAIGLSPDDELSYDMMKHLVRNDIMRVDPESPRSAFIVDGDSVNYYPYVARYYANIGISGDDAKNNLILLEDSFRNKDWPRHWRAGWHDVVRGIWIDISLRDCMKSLLHLGRERGFEMPHGDKTRTTILGALQSFSVSSIYSFVWSAVRSASDYYLVHNVSKKQAANSVVGKIQNYADKVRVGEWDARSFSRFKGHVDNALYSVLFYTVLQVGDSGFTEPVDDCLSGIDWVLPDDL